ACRGLRLRTRRRRAPTRPTTSSRPAPVRRVTRRAPMAKIVLRTVLSLAMSGLFVWLSLRHTDVRAVLAAMGAADPVRIALYVVVLLVIHLVRTVRWGILLEPLDRKSTRLNSSHLGIS